ncbi:hypothetical protein [Bradyrhizobium sp. Ec3.3]|uniref:hypothetical protein n=1 Tax=Bradyrhizobium sp. Ec3.3 TaxID=189753 RepID=UPI0004014A36|nr:hypothetical protein [Bradyrhizobium sp. Ec3.3]
MRVIATAATTGVREGEACPIMLMVTFWQVSTLMRQSNSRAIKLAEFVSRELMSSPWVSKNRKPSPESGAGDLMPNA